MNPAPNNVRNLPYAEVSHPKYETRPLGELLRNLSRDSADLLEGEVRLAKAELEEKVQEGKTQLIQASVGGAVAYAGFLSIVAAGALLLSRIVPLWLSCLCVGIVVGGVGSLMLLRARDKAARAAKLPEKTAENLKTDYHMTKDAIR